MKRAIPMKRTIWTAALVLCGCNMLMDDLQKIEVGSNWECSESPCDLHASCVEHAGEYGCECNLGYSGDGTMCVVDCGEPDPPEDGRVNVDDGTALTSKATYACDLGYELIGEASRTCGSDGFWSGSAPKCQLVNCGMLFVPEDGSVDLSDGIEYQDVARYSCEDGYIISGAAERTCSADGSWSDAAPLCLTHTAMSAAVTTEDWLGLGTMCTDGQIMTAPVYATGPLIVTLNQISPGGPLIGTCSGHTPEVFLIGEDQIDIVLRQPTGSTCAPDCADFVVEIDVDGLPGGDYTITFGDLTTSVPIYH